MKLDLVGEMRLYELDLKTGKPMERKVTKDGISGDTGWMRNLIVETGMEFILDEIFSDNKWNSASGIQGVALGDSTDNNDGTLGPTEGRNVLLADWDKVSEDDWKLTSEIARSAILDLDRVGQTMYVRAQFEDAQLTFVSGVCKIREAGLFLDATTPPTGDPQTNPDEKPYAMVARRVYFGYDDEENPLYYVDQPFYKQEDANPLIFEYRFRITNIEE